MLVIEKSCFRAPSFSANRAGKRIKILWLPLLFLTLVATGGRAQQLLTFNVGGKSYSAEISWVVKHGNIEFKSKTAHSLDLSKAAAFDLAVYFNFINDSVPAGGDVVWGFQFSQNGNLLSPASNEKRSRSKSQFQRFNVSGPGSGGLVITPKAWKKNASGRFDIVGQGNSFTLGLNFTNSALPPVPETTTPVAAVEKPTEAARKPNTPAPRKTDPKLSEDTREENDFTAAKSVTDTIQKVRALIDFVDKYATKRPKSELVARAIKDIPLGVSVPTVKKEGTYTYTLDYPVNLFIDSSKVRGWQWNLSKTPSGKYELTLIDLKDSVHSFTLADSGKNAPFNLPKELSPFEKIRVELLGENSDSFRLRIAGGVPPFIVFLSKNGFPVERFVVEKTNTIQAFSKDDCEGCKNGSYTLEVYNSDFSTLLLRIDQAIHVRKINYMMVILVCVVGFPFAFFVFKSFRRLWPWLVYQKTLLEISIWERKEISEAEKKKKKDRNTVGNL